MTGDRFAVLMALGVFLMGVSYLMFYALAAYQDSRGGGDDDRD